jgi:hypothetical protein
MSDPLLFTWVNLLKKYKQEQEEAGIKKEGTDDSRTPAGKTAREGVPTVVPGCRFRARYKDTDQDTGQQKEKRRGAYLMDMVHTLGLS